MSTIAFKNGVLAADTQVTRGSTTLDGWVRKIHEAEGLLFGAVGEPTQVSVFFKWAQAGMPEDITDFKLPVIEDEDGPATCDFMFIDEEGTIWSSDTFTFPAFFPMHADYHAIGSGASFALGALAFGADAEEAIRIAAKHDMYSGGGVISLMLGGVDQEPELEVFEGP